MRLDERGIFSQYTLPQYVMWNWCIIFRTLFPFWTLKAASAPTEQEVIVHENNEWGICLVDEDVEDKQEDATAPQLTQGVQLAYTVPKQQHEVRLTYLST